MKAVFFTALLTYWIAGVFLLIRHEKSRTGYVTPTDILAALWRSFGWGFELLAYLSYQWDKFRKSDFWKRKVL